MIELKMMRMKEYANWEERQKPRMNFILTKAKPHIHYLPRRMNDGSKALLDTCKADIESKLNYLFTLNNFFILYIEMIDKKRQEVFDELQHIEQRMKKNFDTRKTKSEEIGEDHKTGEDDTRQEAVNDNKEIDSEIQKEIMENSTNGNQSETPVSVNKSTEENWDAEEFPKEPQDEESTQEPEVKTGEETSNVSEVEKMKVDNGECL